MKTPSGFLALSLALLNSLAVAAETEQDPLQIKINDLAGKPVAGVQLFVQNGDARIGAKQGITDAAERATFGNIAPGTYKISAFEKRTPSAAATVVQVGRQGQTTVTLGLAKMITSSNPGKKHKRV
jgi:hypothetical protein